MNKITGVVSRLGVVGEYRVMLFQVDTGLLVDTMTSGTDGTYSFENVPDYAQGYFAVAFDDSETPVNAAVSDQLVIEPMP